MGTPAADLGLACEAFGMDRDQMLAKAGLDAVQAFPDPSARYGGYGTLTSIWRSEYSYPSSSRGGTFTSAHGAGPAARNAPQRPVAARPAFAAIPRPGGERKDRPGHMDRAHQRRWLLQGRHLHRPDPAGPKRAGPPLKGRWLGFGRDPGEINDGPWQFTLADSKVDTEARQRWDHDPDEAPAGQ